MLFIDYRFVNRYLDYISPVNIDFRLYLVNKYFRLYVVNNIVYQKLSMNILDYSLSINIVTIPSQ